VSEPSSLVLALRAVWAIVLRDLRIALRRKSDSTAALFFFLIVASLFPIGVGPEPQLLRVIAPGIVWVAALLASMLSLGRVFADDYSDGTLEQLLLSAHPLPLLLSGKILAHWLSSGLLLSVIAPVLALQFDLSLAATFELVLTLLLGTPLLSLVGAIGAALTVGVRGASVLVSILVLPLYVPVLIFGVLAIDASNAGISTAAQLSLLAAMLAAGLFLAPLAAAAALRISIE
jgi:heme exporter protein B